jgi:hypothetical protein
MIVPTATTSSPAHRQLHFTCCEASCCAARRESGARNCLAWSIENSRMLKPMSFDVLEREVRKSTATDFIVELLGVLNDIQQTLRAKLAR